MDGMLVMLSLFDVAVSLSAAQGQRNSLGILRVFRLLRTLRPLRYAFVFSTCSIRLNSNNNNNDNNNDNDK